VRLRQKMHVRVRMERRVMVIPSSIGIGWVTLLHFRATGTDC
jgi:hypothetical protein